jgi:hypothetical protein
MHTDKKAPAQAATVERQPNSKVRADLSGRQFVHFGAPVGGRRTLRFGFIAGAIGINSWLVEFVTPTFRFQNILTAEAMDSFVFFGTEADRGAFLDDLAAQGQIPPAARNIVGRGEPKGAN